MRVVMVGSGAVGSYFGAKLLQAGNDVVFVARGRQLDALRTNGLRLREVDQETRLAPVDATNNLDAIGPADAVLISVKTWQMAEIAAQLSALRGAHTRFLTLENGVEAPHEVADTVGAAQTLGGLVRGFFELDAPGIVRHVGVRPTIIFGQIDGPRSSEAEELYRAFIQAGIYSELLDNIEAALWEKFMLVTALGSVGADTGLTIGAMRSDAATRALLEQAMTEIEAVARACGILLSTDVVERTLRFVATFPDEATTSMQRDLLNGAPSELEAQTGAVVRLGRAAGIPTPLHQAIYDRLIVRENAARR
jgi:2-dehydropantoate 2-reductase